ncbi:guanylate cyclase soluble subunit beta-1 [Galendromus occidentalis]|uniref:Guanylate cyclase soluble subunit beta-1 n=1 Tax=Galendromus occidentalis TaxID=34638 RepID=A0AAJ6QTY5_9ACAR|nr:guanylate cyclase soluble subunit beta-1 [Galendromus occidentalis]
MVRDTAAYGFVARALELLIEKEYGPETWDEIKKECNLSEEELLSRIVYDDSVLFELFSTTARIVGTNETVLLERFGEYFFEYCQTHAGYGQILRVLGSDLETFLQSIDSLHIHLLTFYPAMKTPNFTCERENDGSLILHYYSYRRGLEWMVVGAIRAVALRLFSEVVAIKILSSEDYGQEGQHTQLRITKSAETIEKEEAAEKFRFPEEKRISPATFCRAFPFHVIFDKEMTVIQAGTSITRILPNMLQDSLCNFMELIQPQMALTFENVLQHTNTVFVLRTKGPDSSRFATRMILKGQMSPSGEGETILFLCSPSVFNLDDLNRRGLYISDIPVHDATRDLVLLSEQFEAEYKLTKNLEVLTDKLQQTYSELEDEKKKTDRLLYSILPPSVANELRHHRPVPAKKYEQVTILFSGVVGFTDYCKRNADSQGAMKIVKLLNDIYTTFDVLTDPRTNPDVYKVETIGDKYMAVSGLPDPCECHAKRIAQLALDLQDLSKKITIDTDHAMEITIGVHCGEVVAGVIGKKMPRYCLFGNSVNLASRTETTGEKGQINISEQVYDLLQNGINSDEDFSFRYRGPVPMKGMKDRMKVWILSRRPRGSPNSLQVP